MKKIIVYSLLSICLFTFEPIKTTEWNYLITEPFRIRYAVAAYLLRSCDEIIEIGGYKTPMSDFVQNKRVTVIDPLVTPKTTEYATNLAIPFQNWRGKPSAKNYGVALLGLELHMPDYTWPKLFDLINKSQKTVIEVSNFEFCQKQFKMITQNVSKKISIIIDLDLSENDFSQIGKDSYPPRCKRKIFVLE